MLLWSLLTTIPKPDTYAEKIVDLGFREGCRVDVPYLDSRVCDGIVLSMDEEPVEALMDYGAGSDRTLEVALKVYYRDEPIYWAPLSEPEFDYIGGTVTLASRQTVRLEAAPLTEGDPALPNVTTDGEGMLTLLDSAQNTDAEDALDDPSLGIVRGADTTTSSDVTRALHAGDDIWGAIKDMADLSVGPDFEIEPFETDPAELASGTVSDNPAATIPDGVITDFPIAVTFPGDVAEVRVGIWAEHTRPQDLDIDLIHPDGTTVRLYTGPKDSDNASTDFLGSSSTGSDLCYFQSGDKSPSVYQTAFPHVGHFRSEHNLSRFTGKSAVGTWKLRFVDLNTGATGTLEHWRIEFRLPAPAYARMNVSDKPVTNDPANPPVPSCVFRAGHGKSNARILTISPQGGLTRNRFTARANGGLRRTRVNTPSRAQIGTYAGDEALEPGDTAAMLALYAQSEVDAYNRPVPKIDLAPMDDTGSNDTLRYGEHFKVGGHVLAEGKRGHRLDGGPRAYHYVVARVTRATLTNLPSSTRCDMEVLATVGALTEFGDG